MLPRGTRRHPPDRYSLPRDSRDGLCLDGYPLDKRSEQCLLVRAVSREECVDIVDDRFAVTTKLREKTDRAKCSPKTSASALVYRNGHTLKLACVAQRGLEQPLD
jgi:hypothetical protein